MPSLRSCVVRGCARTHYAKDYCRTHYYRWKKDGHPGQASIRRYKPSPDACLAENCPRKPESRGYCHTHYCRWSEKGEVGGGEIRAWTTQTAIGYIAAHIRVRKLRGRAATHDCAHCGNLAMDWAYDHEDPDELTQGGGRDAGMVYSLNPDRYVALCRPCHARLDAPFVGRTIA